MLICRRVGEGLSLLFVKAAFGSEHVSSRAKVIPRRL